jgi:hypothetical protein
MYKAPERDKELGFGKRMGDNLYFHILYSDEVMSRKLMVKAVTIAEKVFAERYPDEIFMECETPIIKYNKKQGKVSFLWCPDFDTDLEPAITGYITVDLSTKSGRLVNYKKDFPIYHHKWLMVKDDYKDFDIFPMNEVKKRSECISLLMNCDLFNIDVKKIGMWSYWENEVKPILNRLSNWRLVLSKKSCKSAREALHLLNA